MLMNFISENLDTIGRVLNDIQGTLGYLNVGIAIALIYIAIYAFYIIVCTIMGRDKRYGKAHALSVFLLLIYLTTLLYIVFMSREIGEFEGVNLKPLSTWGRTYVTRALFIENIIMFIPMGILLPCAFKLFRRGRICILTCFLLSLSIEMTQLLFSIGNAELDDILTNTLGGALGWIIWKLCHMIFALILKISHRKKSRKK